MHASRPSMAQSRVKSETQKMYIYIFICMYENNIWFNLFVCIAYQVKPDQLYLQYVVLEPFESIMGNANNHSI